jgi:hypothetical protein
VSARKRYTSRINSRKSTGPRSREGKVRVARNALRHGFEVLTLHDPVLGREAGALMRAIAGTSADAQLIARAWPVALAQLALRRASTARHEILSDPSREPAAAFAAIAAIERYEAKARKQCKLAMAAFEAARREDTAHAERSSNEAHFYGTKLTSENSDRAAPYM